MKKIWLILMILLILAAVLTAVFVFRRGDDPATHGGVRTDNTDPDAPKVIESTELVSFTCSFKASSAEFGGHYYTLEAVLENGIVTGSYRSAGTAEDTVSSSFEAEASFMAELQKIVSETDLAKYNGLSKRVSGLPPRLGASLHAVYASGERIDASNNQSNFLADGEMQALEELFRQAALGE